MVGGWPDQFSVTRWQKALSDVAFQVELEDTYLRIARPRSYLVSSPKMSQNISAAEWKNQIRTSHGADKRVARGSKYVSEGAALCGRTWMMGRTGARFPAFVFGIDGRR